MKPYRNIRYKYESPRLLPHKASFVFVCNFVRKNVWIVFHVSL